VVVCPSDPPRGSVSVEVSMIKVIVFDLGGVLFSEGKSAAMEQLAREQGYNPGLVHQILHCPKSLDLRKGLIIDDEFWNWAQKQLPENYDALLIKKVWYDSYVLDEDVFKLIKKLKVSHRIVAFSGNIKTRIDFLEERYRFRHLFDQEIYSFDHQVTKPDRKFVEVMIDEMKCKPEEIVYIDDNDQYTRPAREMGVRVLIYSRGAVEKLKADLAKLGVLVS
jgi:HAD superfamily hydrolase (TIGR01509 family)